MKSLIQYNFTQGLGDFLVNQFELINTTKNLINIGYIVDLKLNLNVNSYFKPEMFFYFLNEDVYKIFNSIEILDSPILDNEYGEYSKYYTFRGAGVGHHQWDLFLNKINKNLKSDMILHYGYGLSNQTKMIDIFNHIIVKEYKELKIKYNLNDNYDCLHFRTKDMCDDLDYFNFKKSDIDEIIKNTNKIYCCSNSFNFKSYIRNFNNTITIPIIKEEEYGAHFDSNRSLFYDMNIVHERTKFTFFEMLLMSESKKVNTFSILQRPSNFLFLSLINNVNIIHNYT